MVKAKRSPAGSRPQAWARKGRARAKPVASDPVPHSIPGLIPVPPVVPDPPGLATLTAWRAENEEKAGLRCANCGVGLQGPFCHACGQSQEDFERSIGALVPEAFETLFHADSRLPHTLRGLILKPASLTRDYLAGRRASQTPPLRLFLVIVLLFFFVGGLHGTSEPTGLHLKQDAHLDTARLELDGSLAARQFANWLNPRLGYAATHKNEFGRVFEGQFHEMAILFLPIATLILGLLFVGRRRLFLFDHAIFSMHSLSFMGLLFTATTLIGMIPGLRGVAGLIGVAAPVHLFVHMRGTYRISVVGTLLRMLLLFFLSLVAVTFLLVAGVGLGLSDMPATAG